jgi:RNA polymerase sigma-70 factor (ECF subfamily)
MDLEQAVAGLAPGLLRYCLGRTGDRQLAEEVAQEALASLVQRWRAHGPPDSPAAFAFAVAQRRATRALLRRRLFLPFERLSSANGNGDDPGAGAERRSELRRVLRALRRLPRRDRQALLVVVVGELPMTEAALALGSSPAAVKMRVHRARQRLRALLEEAP